MQLLMQKEREKRCVALGEKEEEEKKRFALRVRRNNPEYACMKQTVCYKIILVKMYLCVCLI